MMKTCASVWKEPKEKETKTKSKDQQQQKKITIIEIWQKRSVVFPIIVFGSLDGQLRQVLAPKFASTDFSPAVHHTLPIQTFS